MFVLGVYASAVHARWVDSNGKQVVRALGVASEPYIFWRGEGVKEILSGIEVPEDAGSLELASSSLNGPSGRSLDRDFLAPLKLCRHEAWLCDLVPHSRMNDGQSRAIANHYKPVARRFGLPKVDWPSVKKHWEHDARCGEIVEEILESRAEVLLTLGDEPLKWFCRAHGAKNSLRAYGTTSELYGSLNELEIEGQQFKLLPLVHPRQAARLGRHSPEWARLHASWRESKAPDLLG